jgi:S1-C subfamily serine protease
MPLVMKWLAAGCFAIATLPSMDAMVQRFPPVAFGQPAGDAPLSSSSGLGTIDDYMGNDAGPVDIPQLGIAVRNGSAKLADGRQISGVKVVEVLASGPATKALDSHKTGRFILDGALFVTAAASVVFCPPALIGVVMLAHSHVGESYDLVIAVDGYRVRNALDLVSPLRQAQSGDVVYMVVIRNGHRHQVSIQVR